MWKWPRLVFKHLWAAFGVLTAVIGVAGLSEDLAKWSQWIDAVVSDPLVLAMARQAVEIAEFVNQVWFRIALVLAGLLMVIWPVRWFWRLRHRLVFWWRRRLEEEVWTDAETAYKLVRESSWAKAREPSVSFADAMARSLTTGETPSQKSMRKFNRFCGMALEQFVAANPDYSRKTGDGTTQYREDKLRTYLKRAFDADVREAFGDVPNFKV